MKVTVDSWGFMSSPRENYLRSAGQNVRQVFNALPDILIPCQTFISIDNRQILNPAGHFVRQGQSPLPDISKTLPDMSGMSGIFREDCSWGFTGIHNILVLSMNPHESEGGFMGENKSPWIPMTHESPWPMNPSSPEEHHWQGASNINRNNTVTH